MARAAQPTSEGRGEEHAVPAGTAHHTTRLEVHEVVHPRAATSERDDRRLDHDRRTTAAADVVHVLIKPRAKVQPPALGEEYEARTVCERSSATPEPKRTRIALSAGALRMTMVAHRSGALGCVETAGRTRVHRRASGGDARVVTRA